jgi:hypothetical protein
MGSAGGGDPHFLIEISVPNGRSFFILFFSHGSLTRHTVCVWILFHIPMSFLAMAATSTSHVSPFHLSHLRCYALTYLPSGSSNKFVHTLSLVDDQLTIN